MKLVPDWKTLHKSFTVVLAVVGFILGLFEAILPALGVAQPFLDPVTYGSIMAVLTLSIAIGRYIKQEAVKLPQPKAE
jgi:hypothetical protein